MPLRVDFSILNQKGTPAFFSDIFANRPAAGFAGRVFISTDTGAIYEDTGSTWTLIADAGAGTTGTLQQVTTNGNTTTQGLVVTTGNVAIGTAVAGAPLDIHGTGTLAQFNGTGTSNAYAFFQNASTNKWRIGNTYNAGSNDFNIHNNNTASNPISINGGTNIATFNGGIVSTGSADQQLWVYGSSPSLRLYNAITSPSIIGFLGMATATNNFIQGSANADMAIGTSTGGKILFGTASGTINPQLTLTSTNFVGINKINPTVALDVVGAATFSSSVSIDDYLRLTKSSSVDIQAYTGSAYTNLNYDAASHNWQTGGGTAKMILSNAGALTITALGTGTVTATSGTLSTVSDMNYKIDAGFIDNAINKLINLKPRYFYWNEKSGLPTDIKQLGFYAQEVNIALGEEVANTPKNETIPWGITDRSIIAFLVKAIQELNEKLVKNNIN